MNRGNNMGKKKLIKDLTLEEMIAIADATEEMRT